MLFSLYIFSSVLHYYLCSHEGKFTFIILHYQKNKNEKELKICSRYTCYTYTYIICTVKNFISNFFTLYQYYVK